MLTIDSIAPGSYGQRLCSKTGLIMPWYTHGALEEIEKFDLQYKTVFEWGGGCSTFWWSRVAKQVFTTEAHQDWADWLINTAKERGFTNIFVECKWPSPLDSYLKLPDGCFPDIVCVDGSIRSECVLAALRLPRPLTLIVDNWMQDGVYLDFDLERLMLAFKGSFHIQADHTAHEGRPWQTAIWHLDNTMPVPAISMTYDEKDIASWRHNDIVWQ